MTDSDAAVVRNQVLNFGETERPAFMSLYHGDFENIGHELAAYTNGFEDFTLLMNVPYGE